MAEWFDDDLIVGSVSEPAINECLAAAAAGVDISNGWYHSLPGMSGSNLSLLAESNKHLDNKILFNLGTSPALTFGTLLHTMVLEPHDIAANYAVMPIFEPAAITGITIVEAKKQFYHDSAGKIAVEKDLFLKAEKMARNVRAITGDIIDTGIKERSLFADLDGVICKCRLDIDIDAVGDDYDLKSITLGTKDFSDSTLESHIKKLRYHWSAAFRNIIRRALGKPVRDSYLIFCNTGMGHMVRVVRISPTWIKDAEAVVNDLLDSRRFYLLSNQDLPVIDIDDRLRKFNY
jgi:hypothetical protein